MTTLTLERVWGGEQGRLPPGFDTVALTDAPDVAYVLGNADGRGAVRVVDVRTGETRRAYAIPALVAERRRVVVSRVSPDGTLLVAATDEVGAFVGELALDAGVVRTLFRAPSAPRVLDRLDDGGVLVDGEALVDARVGAWPDALEARWLSRDGRWCFREVSGAGRFPVKERPRLVERATGAEKELRLCERLGAQGVFTADAGFMMRLAPLYEGDRQVERWTLPQGTCRPLRPMLPASAWIVATRDDGLALVDPGEFGEGPCLVAEDKEVVDYDPGAHGGGAWTPQAASVSPDGRRFGRVRNGVLRVTDLVTGDESVACAGHIDAVRSVALSHDGALAVAGGADGQITVWDVAEGDTRWRLEGGGGAVTQVALSPDARQLYALVERRGDAKWRVTLQAWDVRDGGEITPGPMEFAFGAHLELSPDGTRGVVTYADEGRGVPAWVDLAAWRARRYAWKEFAPHIRRPIRPWPSRARFAPGGAQAQIEWGASRTVDARTGGLGPGSVGPADVGPATGTERGKPASSARIARGPTLVATCTDAGEVQLRARKQRAPAASSKDAAVALTSVALSGDERTLLAGAVDGRILVYRVAP